MPKVLLRNINPLGFVDLPLIGRQGATDDPDGDQPGSGCLIPGEVFSVDAEIAGRAPQWRPVTEDDADLIAVGHIETREVNTAAKDEDPVLVLEVHDLGSGLLAQVGNFEVAEDDLDKKTVDELVAYAAEQEPPIDISGLKKKADILAALRKG